MWAVLRSIRRRQTLGVLLDLGVAVVLGGYAAATALRGGDWPEPHEISAALAALAGVALAWRRRRPLLAYTATMGALATVYLTLGHYEAGSAVLIALVASYSVTAYGGNLPYATAIAVGFALSAGLGQPATEASGDVIWTAAALALPLGLGLTTRSLRLRSAGLERQAQDLRVRQEALTQAAAADAAAQERRRIAHELHDIISHSLGVMVLHAGVAEEVLARDPSRSRESMQLIRTTGQEAIAELGRLVDLTRDGAPAARWPQPTLDDIHRVVAGQRAAGLDTAVDVKGEVRPIPAAVELSAFRVVQEGLTNAGKHAGSAQIRVVLRYSDRGLEVEVNDDGQRHHQGDGNRLGLLGLRERVAVFGGDFEAGPAPQGGWHLRAFFPTSS